MSAFHHSPGYLQTICGGDVSMITVTGNYHLYLREHQIMYKICSMKPDCDEWSGYVWA